MFTRYPKIFKNLQVESFEAYNKHIFKPINSMRRKEISNMNLRSIYKTVSITREIDLDKDLKEYIQNQGNYNGKGIV